MCKIFYGVLFAILFIHEIFNIALGIYAGLTIISPQAYKTAATLVNLYHVSFYLSSGLFISALLLMFWMFRLAYEYGCMGASEQLLLPNISNLHSTK